MTFDRLLQTKARIAAVFSLGTQAGFVTARKRTALIFAVADDFCALSLCCVWLVKWQFLFSAPAFRIILSMLKKISWHVFNDLSIDFGYREDTLILCKRTKAIVLNEPSLW